MTMDLLDWAQPKLNEAIQTACDCAHLPLLPQWSSIVLASFAACQLLYAQIGPALTRWLLPKKYPNLTDRKRLDWDIHVVSFTNAAVITYLSTRVVLFDQERKQMTWQQRAWGFTESSAFVLAVANGYFYWHLIMMIRYHRVYGLAMVAHAVSVSFLMTNGFVSMSEQEISWKLSDYGLPQRPAFVTYAPVSLVVAQIETSTTESGPGHSTDNGDTDKGLGIVSVRIINHIYECTSCSGHVWMGGDEVANNQRDRFVIILFPLKGCLGHLSHCVVLS